MTAYRGFAQITHNYVRELVPDFDWVCFDEPSPRVPPRRPLQEARVALVGTAGAHLPQQRHHHGGDDGDHTYRVIPAEAQKLRLHHPGYDARRARKDPDVVFPLALMRNMAAEGAIGELSPRAYAFMGYIPHTGPLTEVTGPEVSRALVADDVDLVVLVPT